VRRPDSLELDTLDDLDAVGAEQGVAHLVDRWLPLSYALNAVNRSIGKPDLYPFVLTPQVISKLDAVHVAIRQCAESAGPVGPVGSVGSVGSVGDSRSPSGPGRAPTLEA
jgi:hypothetical protein